MQNLPNVGSLKGPKMRPNEPRVLLVEGYNAALTINRGHLVVRDGFPADEGMRELWFPRGQCVVERIIVRAPAGTVSVGSIDWCHRMGIALAFVGSDSRLINCLMPDSPHDGLIKRAQAVAGLTDFAIEPCRWLLKRKFASQIEGITSLWRFFASEMNPEIGAKICVVEIRKCEAELSACDTLDRFLSLEGLW